MNTSDRITLEPGKKGGRPYIRGLRISVHDVLAMLAEGMAETEILEDFPELEAEDIRACLAYAVPDSVCREFRFAGRQAPTFAQ